MKQDKFLGRVWKIVNPLKTDYVICQNSQQIPSRVRHVQRHILWQSITTWVLHHIHNSCGMVNIEIIRIKTEWRPCVTKFLEFVGMSGQKLDNELTSSKSNIMHSLESTPMSYSETYGHHGDTLFLLWNICLSLGLLFLLGRRGGRIG